MSVKITVPPTLTTPDVKSILIPLISNLGSQLKVNFSGAKIYITDKIGISKIGNTKSKIRDILKIPQIDKFLKIITAHYTNICFRQTRAITIVIHSSFHQLPNQRPQFPLNRIQDRFIPSPRNEIHAA